LITSEEFFNQDAISLAKDLIGKHITRTIDGHELTGKIVETEAYMGIDDRASHTYRGKKTKRTEILYGEGGFAYVYTIYGIYQCLNIVANHESIPQAVFIRALEPIVGLENMREYRKTEISKIKNLTNGPSKLCQSLRIDKQLYGYDLKNGGELYINNSNEKISIASSPRINIDYSGPDKSKPWRFFDPKSDFLSK